MFDLPCGVRLRAFEPSPPSGTTTSDLDNILAIHHDTVLAPLITQRFLVPRGNKLKDEFKDAIENQTEMFCIIESIPASPELTSDPAPAPTDGKPPMHRVAWNHETPRFLGFTALWAFPERGLRHSLFSLVLVHEAQGKGIGTAVTRFVVDHAFTHLYMHRISLAVFEGNDKALAVYRKW